MVELLRGGFVRISDDGIAARVLWKGKLRLYFFFTRVFVIRWQNETCNFFVFLASELEDVIDERFVNVVIIPEAERTPVRLLKQGCMKFQSQFKEICGFNPMKECITIASACNVAYRKNWMPENKIAVEPVRGWRPKHSQSRIFYTCVCDKMT